MGLSNIGGGKFLQRYRCKKCGKVKEIVKWKQQIIWKKEKQ